MRSFIYKNVCYVHMELCQIYRKLNDNCSHDFKDEYEIYMYYLHRHVLSIIINFDFFLYDLQCQ